MIRIIHIFARVGVQQGLDHIVLKVREPIEEIEHKVYINGLIQQVV